MRYVDESELRDAQMEEYDNAHPHDMECDECGATWHGAWTRSSRYQPSEPRLADCPECAR